MQEIELLIETYDVDNISEIEGIEEFVKNIQFTGFNPFATLKALTLIESNQKILMKDMSYLIVLAIERGTNTLKMVKTIGDKAVNIVRDLISKYNIKPNLSGKKDNITLSRIVMTFPWLSCGYMSKAVNPVVSFQAMKELATIPRVMMNTAYASLLSKNDVNFEDKRDSHLLYMYLFNKTINPQNTDSIQKTKDSLLTYFTASNNSDYIKESKRKDLNRSWNLDSAIEEIKIAAKVFRNLK